MKPTIVVFSASRNGTSPEFAKSAFELGAALAERGMTVMNGGGSTGLMAAVVDGVLSVGGFPRVCHYPFVFSFFQDRARRFLQHPWSIWSSTISPNLEVCARLCSLPDSSLSDGSNLLRGSCNSKTSVL